MSTRGRSGLARWALGSVAQKVAHQAPVPVLLLRDQGPSPLGSAGHVHGPLRALVPLDGSELAEAALLPAARLVGALAAPGPAAVHLVKVVDLLDLAALPEDWGDARRPAEARAREWAVRQATAYLGDVAARLRADLGDRPLALTLTWSVAVEPEAFTYAADVASMIVRAAEVGEPTEGATAPERCDLIAMATHGHGGLARFIMGSVAERVLHASALPLLLVRPRGASPARSRPDAAVSDS
jgi:nucleotide-binding universal stress UspA family protein